MKDIICPNCKKAFKVDEAGFADILKQVRDHQFEKELQDRLNIAEKDKENAVKLAEANITNTLQKNLAKKRKMDNGGWITVSGTLFFIFLDLVSVMLRRIHRQKVVYYVSYIPTRGPGPDIVHFQKAIIEAKKNTSLNVLVADAGYDSEKAHVFAREKHNIRTIIPPLIGRKTSTLPTGMYRRRMALRFNKKLYGQRWQVETVNSMITRNLGSFLRARSYWSQCREIMLRLFTHHVMIVWG